ncbi:MAG: AzlD domain-containing protein [Coriobacteriia bacterium]|nr:AzlD domain-containing protein [Coriobacteriia bacterium]
MTILAQNAILITILGMTVLNFALRFTPLVALTRIKLPEVVTRWLSFVPISVMGALFATQILLPAWEQTSGKQSIPLYFNPGIFGALAAMLVFKLTKSFIGGTVAGVVVFVLVRWLVIGVV